MKTIVRRVLATIALASAALGANAQMIDDADLRAQGADAVLQVRFVTPIQLLRATGAPRGELARVFYDVPPARNVPRLVPSERRIVAAGLPQIVVADEGAAQAGQARRLTIRFSQATRFSVRAGADNRSIEVVLDGLGAALRAASTIPPLPIADATRRFVVTLQSSSDPNVSLAAPIPASMQDLEVFSSRRVTDGRTLFDINLGYFTTQQEAERARSLLLRRFAQAAVTELPLLPVAQARVAALPPAPAPARPPTTAPGAAATAGAAVAAGAATASPLGLGGVAAGAASQVAPLLPRAPAAPAAPVVAATPTLPPAAEVSRQAGPAPADPPPAPIATAEQVNTQAASLLRQAQASFDKADYAASVEALNSALNLPPNPSSRRAQELIATARLRQGDAIRARSELELFLRLYPQGADSDRARQALAALPAQPVPPAAGSATLRPRPPVQPTTTLNASLAQYYFGGKSKTRTQEFQDSPLGGLPTSIADTSVSDTDQSQLQSNADLNWRHRDAEQELRFVFRDTYSYDLLNKDKSKNRLSALYVDHRSYSLGTSVRAGRQSPNSGGVLYLFDGVQGGYGFAPKWKVNGVFGVPTEKLLDAKRSFFGASIDAEALTDQLSGNVYLMQQLIDGVVDRRAVGSELRFFSGGISASTQLDYDVLFKTLNIAAFQGTWQFSDNTVINTLYDKRAVSILTLGNLLFFQGTGVPLLVATPTRVSDLLALSTLEQLRERSKAVTAYQRQALLGLTTPIAKQWQWGADVRLTHIGQVLPVPEIGFAGSPSSGKQWSTSTQFIGSNLYSTRDSHVLSFTYLSGPTMKARQVAYNNLSAIDTLWQVEPSIRYFTQNDASGMRNQRWSPGLRLTLRPVPAVSLESDLAYERSTTESVLSATPTAPATTTTQTSSRVFYFLGLRYEF